MDKHGRVTYHGKSFAPEETPAGGAHVTVKANGDFQVNEGSLTEKMKLALKSAVNARSFDPEQPRDPDGKFASGGDLLAEHDAIKDNPDRKEWLLHNTQSEMLKDRLYRSQDRSLRLLAKSIVDKAKGSNISADKKEFVASVGKSMEFLDQISKDVTSRTIDSGRALARQESILSSLHSQILSLHFALMDTSKSGRSVLLGPQGEPIELRFNDDQPRDPDGKFASGTGGFTTDGTKVEGDVKTTTYTKENQPASNKQKIRMRELLKRGYNHMEAAEMLGLVYTPTGKLVQKHHSVVVIHDTKANTVTVKHLDAKGDLLVQQTHDSVGAARKELQTQGIDHKFYAIRTVEFGPQGEPIELRFNDDQPRDPDGKFASDGKDSQPASNKQRIRIRNCSSVVTVIWKPLKCWGWFTRQREN